MLTVNSISKSYGTNTVLKNISFRLNHLDLPSRSQFDRLLMELCSRSPMITINFERSTKHIWFIEKSAIIMRKR